MKLSLDSLGTRQRLRIGVPAVSAILRYCFKAVSFGIWGAIQESSSAKLPPTD